MIVISGRHRPHEILLFVASVILGASWIQAVPPPHSMSESQPHWVLHAWAGAMLVSGILGLISCIPSRASERLLRLEMGALTLGTATMVIYATSLFTVAGTAALGSWLTFAAWGIANGWRICQVLLELRMWRRSGER